LTISDCQPLISKIDARINGWEGISLSYAGRVQIIKSVLSALSLYWASAFILPKKVISEIGEEVEDFPMEGYDVQWYAKGGTWVQGYLYLDRALMSKNYVMLSSVTGHPYGFSALPRPIT
ncbi:UNVERIFIED_CONTAM: hypothetical protein Sindi_3063800, partial [Sesamum indicum]